MIDDPNFIATYYNYFKNMDISDFHIRSIPYTEYQQDLQELSVSPLELFIIYIIEMNYDEREYKEYAGSIYSDYKQFCKSRGWAFVFLLVLFSLILLSSSNLPKDCSCCNVGVSSS